MRASGFANGRGCPIAVSAIPSTSSGHIGKRCFSGFPIATGGNITRMARLEAIEVVAPGELWALVLPLGILLVAIARDLIHPLEL
jgi:hypothetical protein